MKTKLALVAVLVAAGTFWAVAQSNEAKNDPRVDKLLEQHDKMLKNQEEMLKNQAEILRQLETINNSVQTIRRRSS
jgi:uncharacterized membrane protein (DUF106 family)